MAIVSAAISVRSANFNKVINPVYADLFSLSLKSGVTYDIGIDQSSFCTGIGIQSLDSDINIIIEVRNNASTKTSYYRELKGILHNLVLGHDIRNVICEDPPPVKNKRYSSQVLLELRGQVEEWCEEVAELQKANFRSIFPQTWKARVVKKEKGKNRSNNKECIASDICDDYPEFEYFKNEFSARSYDAFDAVGILIGYKKYAYSEDGLPMICGKMESRHTSLVGYKYVPVDSIMDKTVNNFMGKAISILKPVYLNYNYDYNKFENIRMATSNWDCSYTILPDTILDLLKWQYDLEKKENYVLLAYFFNLSHFPQATKTGIKSMFEMKEEVTTC